MTFLPLVARELRVQSRRRSSYWIRWSAALGTLLLVVVVAGAGGGAGSSAVFRFVSGLLFAGAIAAGVFLGADSLSEERREGTLGLLFLTDLRSHDVVLGKMMGVALSPFYSLLATLPVLTLCVLVGGVTGGDYWRTALALLNALFFSFALSMLVSSRAIQGNAAVYRALTSLVLIYFCVTILEPHAPVWLLGWLSFHKPFLLATDVHYRGAPAAYWVCLMLSHLTGWAMIVWAGRRLADHFDESQSPQQHQTRATAVRRRSQLLNINPILWLVDDSPLGRLFPWLLSILAIAAATVIHLVGADDSVSSSLIVVPFFLALLLQKILLAIQACRFFVESRHTGALELLRTTPLTAQEMLDGQYLAITRAFFPPLMLLAVGGAVVVCWTSSILEWPPTLMFFVGFAATQYLDLGAIGWYGMWMGLSCPKIKRAVWLTALGAVILPYALVCVPNIIIDCVLLWYCRPRCLQALSSYLALRREETSDQRAVV